MNRRQLFDLCKIRFIEKKLDKKHGERFESEWNEITRINEDKYFIELVESKTKFAVNENNLIIPYLLGIVDNFDITKDVKYNYGDMPDVDIDYPASVRDYLKGDFAKEQFGSEYICNIASYSTYGMKSALKDMARIFGLPHKDVDIVTKILKDKDDDGKTLTWDQAIEVFDELKDYCKANPEVADAAKRLVGRIRGYGQHASGLVVSSVPIHEHIPLIRGKEGSVSSAWTEGLSGQDLSTVGFIKFDFLSLDANQKISTACKLSCEDEKFRKEAKLAENSISSCIGEDTVCALPGQPSWSDTSYLNDPKCMEMANRGDLRLIFQFDGSPGIRNMASKGGVDRFEDLVAYASLFRPGPMKLGAHEQYIKRKRGIEEWSVHPLLADGPGNLNFTYNVIVYQEQIGRILNTVGKIPLDNCEEVRKAISKKKVEKFQKYKDMFITNGQKTLGQSKEEVEHLFKLVEAFSSYGFNHCIIGNHTIKDTISGKIYTIADLSNNFIENIKLLSYKNNKIIEDDLIDVFPTGEKEVFEVILDNGMTLQCTLDHKFMCSDNKIHTLKEIINEELEILWNEY